jgi:hypothetical protein
MKNSLKTHSEELNSQKIGEANMMNDGDEKQIIYKGYTIKHKLQIKPKYPFDAKSILTTIIPGTDFKNTESTPYIHTSKLLKAITKHLETAEKKAIIYIDAIETDTDDDNGDNGEIPGCTDSTATNYDESATQDDGSCEQPSEDSENMILYGLMAATALSVSVLIYVLGTNK